MSDATRPVTEALLDVDLSGRQLGGYRLLRRLGRGAMAEVYLAEQTIARPAGGGQGPAANLANDATYVAAVPQEARAAARLVHANIVQIYEVGCVDGIHYIAQEYVQGRQPGRIAGPPRSARPAPRAGDHAAGGRRAAQGGRAGHRPSRHQAREHHARGQRRGEGGRLRPGPAV